MSHAPPFGCNEYPPGGARPDEEAFVSTEQQSPKHTIFLQRNSKVGVELSMAIVIEGYVNIAGKRSNCEFPAYPGVPGRFYEVIMPDAFKTSLLQTTCIKLQKCVETGSSFLYVAVDELDALLDQAINGTA